jgi:hypothetical protein
MLLKHIAKMIKHQEYITIFVKAVSNDGKHVVEFEQPLDQITNYAFISAHFTEKFSKFVHGVKVIDTPYSFELTFLDSTQEKVMPPHLIDFFQDFFARRVTHENVSLIDVAFWDDDFYSKDHLLKSDYLRIIELLGYEEDSDYMFEICGFNPQEKPSPKPKKPGFLDSEYLAKIDAYTPDYKNHGSLRAMKQKADNTQKLILSAI